MTCVKGSGSSRIGTATAAPCPRCPRSVARDVREGSGSHTKEAPMKAATLAFLLVLAARGCLRRARHRPAERPLADRRQRGGRARSAGVSVHGRGAGPRPQRDAGVSRRRRVRQPRAGQQQDLAAAAAGVGTRRGPRRLASEAQLLLVPPHLRRARAQGHGHAARSQGAVRDGGVAQREEDRRVPRLLLGRVLRPHTGDPVAGRERAARPHRRAPRACCRRPIPPAPTSRS